MKKTVDLRNGPITRSLIALALPLMGMSCIQMAYNLIDMFWIGQLGAGAVASVGTGGLLIWLSTGIHMVAQLGGQVYVGQNLGRGDHVRAGRYAAASIYLSIAVSLALGVLFFFGKKPIIAFFQLNSPEVVVGAEQYLAITGGFILFQLLAKLLTALITTTGDSKTPFVATAVGLIFNIIVDPILIFGWLGFDAMGVTGAAYATVIGQIVAATIAYSFHRKYNKHISAKIRSFKPNFKIIKKIYIIGSPAIIAQALIAFMAYFLNIIFVLASESIVTVYGLYYKIQQFVIMAVFGLRDAAMPIISFSYATNKKRLKESIKYLLIYTTVIMAVGTLFFELLASVIASAFGLSGDTMDLCISAIRIVSLSFVFAGFNIACQAIFQAMNSGVKSLIISFGRQIIFVLPVAYGFTMLAKGNTDLTWTVWLTFVIAEVATAIIAFVLHRIDYKNKVSVLKDAPADIANN